MEISMDGRTSSVRTEIKKTDRQTKRQTETQKTLGVNTSEGIEISIRFNLKEKKFSQIY
jgi:hypothetical protein